MYPRQFNKYILMVELFLETILKILKAGILVQFMSHFSQLYVARKSDRVIKNY